MKHPFRLKRLPILLLEVLIAMALVALCVLPLIYPHVFILRSEKNFISTVELDHVVNLLYADVLQKLYQNEISWQDVESGREMPIESTMLNGVDYKKEFPFSGNYRFIKIRQKPKKESEKNAYLFNLEFTFTPKPGVFLDKKSKDKLSDSTDNGSKIIYKYQVPVERLVK